jgi:hypothetical protein
MPEAAKADKGEHREDLRRRLRAKLRKGRNSQERPLPQQMRDDPLTTLLALGVDDVSILQNSSQIVNNPYAALQALAAAPVEKGIQPTRTVNTSVDTSINTDDEEAPPPPV